MKIYYVGYSFKIYSDYIKMISIYSGFKSIVLDSKIINIVLFCKNICFRCHIGFS